MLRAYRLIYLYSPYAPPTLWEWEQPWIHHLVVNARSFGTTRVTQRYFRDWNALACENVRIWEEHYRSRPLYGHIETWEKWMAEYRQLILDVQEIYDEKPDWRSPESTRPL
jgi:hypothetical protein